MVFSQNAKSERRFLNILVSVHPETRVFIRHSKKRGLEGVSNIVSASLFSADINLFKSI